MTLRDEPVEIAKALLNAYKAQTDAFVDVAERFCRVVANRKTYTQVGFLQAIEPPLAELYVRAMALPDTSLWYSDDSDDEDELVGSESASEQDVAVEQIDVRASVERMRQEREEEFPLLATSFVDNDQQMSITDDIEALLEQYNLYKLVFDPFGDGESGRRHWGTTSRQSMQRLPLTCRFSKAVTSLR